MLNSVVDVLHISAILFGMYHFRKEVREFGQWLRSWAPKRNPKAEVKVEFPKEEDK
jgi:hypothetical protein